MKVEEKAVVLDYLPRGRSTGFKTEPIAQVLGVDYFTLLEVVPKENMEVKADEVLYVGKENREKVDHIKRRIGFKDLTTNSVTELERVVENLVTENESKYVEFFNNSTSITLRRHKLELLPGLGKKHLFQILQEREKKPFESFKDISERVSLLPSPKKLIVRRVLEEMKESSDQRHYLFVRPPAQERERPERKQPFRRF
jgi:putative nucleotide binding protein